MRLRFDENDENDAESTRKLLVERFSEWLEDRPERVAADPGDVDLALSWKWAYADGDYGRWHRSDIDDLLLGHLPRKLSATPDEAASIPSSVAAFMRFLDDEGLLDSDSEPAEVVANRALAQQRAFLDAMADPTNFGMAKRLFANAGLGAEDLTDQASLDEAMARFNSLSFEERGAILGIGHTDWDADDGGPFEPDGWDVPLPVRSMASAADLDELAGSVPLLGQVEALRRGIGSEGVTLTKAGNLSLSDGRRLVEAVRVADRTEGIRSSTELPRLFAVNRVAMEAGAVEVVGNRIRASEVWGGLTPGDRWGELVDAIDGCGPATLRFGAVTPMPLQLAEVADVGTAHLLATLWLADEPLPVEMLVELIDVMAQAAGDEDRAYRGMRVLSDEARRRLAADRAADVVDVLAEAGVLAYDDHLEPPVVELTDAGARLVVPWLRDAGFEVLVPEEVAGLDASALVNLLMDCDTDPAEVVALWAAARSSASEAATELLGALPSTGGSDPAVSLIVFSLLSHLGPPAFEPVRQLLDTEFAPHAWMFLVNADEVTIEDAPIPMMLRAGIDTMLATVQLGSPADVVESFLGQFDAGGDTEFLDVLGASDHPRTGEVLELLGRHHPDKSIGKHARKVAHRWRSAHGGRSRR